MTVRGDVFRQSEKHVRGQIYKKKHTIFFTMTAADFTKVRLNLRSEMEPFIILYIILYHQYTYFFKSTQQSVKFQDQDELFPCVHTINSPLTTFFFYF